MIMAVVVAYTLVAGWQAPIVRAAVLALLWCVAAWSGRRGFGFNALAASAIVVLAFNPADLFPRARSSASSQWAPHLAE